MGATPELSGLSDWPAYVGPEKAMDGGILRTKLQVVLRRQSDSEEDAPLGEAALDIEGLQSTVVTLYDTENSERVQLLDVTLSADTKLAVYSGDRRNLVRGRRTIVLRRVMLAFTRPLQVRCASEERRNKLGVINEKKMVWGSNSGAGFSRSWPGWLQCY